VERGGQFVTDRLQEALMEKEGNKVRLPYLRNKDVLNRPALLKMCYNDFFDDIKKAVCKVHETSTKNLFFNKVVDNKVYELPDEQNLTISREYYDVPELLFKPAEVSVGLRQTEEEILPLHKSVNQAIEKIPHDKRKEILSNIILSGGTANLTGLADRLQKMLGDTCTDSFYIGKIKIW
jgi:actin-related protein